jgi:hypothetical protein
LLAEPEVDGFAPRLSSDGKWLAFLRWPAQQDVEEPMLFVTALGTGIHTKVADRFAMPGHTIDPPFDLLGSAMIWSHDRSDLYFVARNSANVPEIRRFRAGSASSSDVVVGNFAKKDVVSDLALSKNNNTLGYNRLADKHVEIHIHDLGSQADRVVLREPAAMRGTVELKGWRAGDTVLIALRSMLGQGPPFSADVIQVGVDGMVGAQLQVPQRAFTHGARFSAVSGELYVTTVNGVIHNVSVFSIADGRLRQLTHNTSTGVTFSGIEAAPDGTLVFSRQQSKQNIWAIKFRR